MTEVAYRIQRLGDEVTEGLAQLVTVATETGSTVDDESRKRAAEALRALRGERRRRWPWLVLGAIIGFGAGAVVMAQRHQLPQPGTDNVDASEHGFADTLRERTAPARDAATRTMHRTVDKVRDRLPARNREDDTS